MSTTPLETRELNVPIAASTNNNRTNPGKRRRSSSSCNKDKMRRQRRKLEQNSTQSLHPSAEDYYEGYNINFHPYAHEIHISHLDNEEYHWTGISIKDFYKKHPEITSNMRAILVDWLVEVANCYHFTPQTLFLSVSYLDCFMETVNTQISRKTLQLAGITCLLIAAKYEESVLPSISQFVEVTDNSYTQTEILRMELLILNTLKFRLTVSTVLNFLNHFLQVAGLTKPVPCFLANYLAELTIVPHSFKIKYKPSMVAASIVYIVNCSFNQPQLSPLFEAFTGYSHVNLVPCIRHLYHLHELVTGNFKYKSAPRDKYLAEEFNHVAKYPLSEYPF